MRDERVAGESKFGQKPTFAKMLQSSSSTGGYVTSEAKPSLPCPCCYHLTISERGGFEICPVCSWEDDGQDDKDAAVVRGGPNGLKSLAEGRANFRAFGASDKPSLQHVRRPYAHELP